MIINNRRWIPEKGGKMPYISVKAFPMDEETKRKTAEQILEVFQKTWGRSRSGFRSPWKILIPKNGMSGSGMPRSSRTGTN